MTGGNLDGFGILGDRLQLSLPAAAPGGSLSLFDMQGSQRIELTLGPLGAGTHRVDLPELAPGVYSMRVALGPFSGSAHLVHSGKGIFLMQGAAGDRHASDGSRNGGVSPLPPVTDYTANGPFTVVTEANVGPNNAISRGPTGACKGRPSSPGCGIGCTTTPAAGPISTEPTA